MPARKRSDIDWDAIRQDVEADKPITAIAKQHNVDRKTIRDRQKAEGWLETSQEPADERRAYWLDRVNEETETAQWPFRGDKRAHQINGTASKRSVDNAAMILTLIEKGMSATVAAGSIGVMPATLSLWKADDPGLQELIEEAAYRPVGLCEANISRIGATSDWKASERFLTANRRSRDKWRDQAKADHGITVTITSRDGDEITVKSG